jgi:tetratricopeptide (TPR) repeat protein
MSLNQAFSERVLRRAHHSLNGQRMDQIGTVCLLSAAGVCFVAMLSGSLFLWIVAFGLAITGMGAHVLSPHVEARRLVRHARKLAELGRLREAIAYTNRAIALVPDVTGAFVVRSALYAGIGQLDMAVDDAEHAVRLSPRHPEARLARARMYSRYGLHEDAILDLQVGLDERPDWAAGYLESAYLYVRLQEYEKALEALATLQQHVRAVPSRYEAYLLAGWICEEKLKDVERALTAYGRAIALQPERRVGYARRATLYTARGDRLQAAEDWLRAAECPPHESERNRGAWLRAVCYGKRYALTAEAQDWRQWREALEQSVQQDAEPFAKRAQVMLRLMANPQLSAFPPRPVFYVN